jgi:hypothetical protein
VGIEFQGTLELEDRLFLESPAEVKDPQVVSGTRVARVNPLRERMQDLTITL